MLTQVVDIVKELGVLVVFYYRSSGRYYLLSDLNVLDADSITTTIRASRGQDIWAACGLLSTKKLMNKE